MENNELISVVVPVYKVEAYLHRCVDSILAQTYKHLEVILVDDGSPDSCGEICDSYLEKDSRIKVIHQKNGGLSAARNAGLEIASGQYILFIDSDDWIKPELCENVLKEAVLHDADIVVFGYSIIDEMHQILSDQVVKERRLLSGVNAVKSLLSNKLENYAWNKLYRRELFQTIRYPEGFVWEDVGTTYKLFLKAKKIYLLNKSYYFYFQRSTNITSNITTKALYDIFTLRRRRYEDLHRYDPSVAELGFRELVESAFAYYHWGVCPPVDRRKLKEVEKFLAEYKARILQEAGHFRKIYYKMPIVYRTAAKIRYNQKLKSQMKGIFSRMKGVKGLLKK